MTLDQNGFREFFQALHGHPPFPWQSRLLARVLAEGWPAALALPTACGKTAVLDVAVFALACEARRPAGARRTPRRIALIVDRRIVVDDAHARADRIRAALAAPSAPILRAVADALAGLGGETPLDTALLRGGMYREDRWARTSAQPVLLCSTVDQVGSRLLFRGYGLSTAMWPIHAGLLANDTLLILDEAHCSEPFRQTIESVARFRAAAERPTGLPFHVLTMSATPRGVAAPFALDVADYATPALRLRLAARKPARLAVWPDKDALVAKQCLAALRGDADTPGLARPGETLFVVVNRVATARAIRRALEEARQTRRAADRLDCDALLLTGRCRPCERERLIAQWRDRLISGRSRDAVRDKKPLIVVATQCVEVGADFDVDALITECCAFDALRQRLGRLDRLGERGESPVLVFAREKSLVSPDPIYGAALAKTWAWLSEQASTPFDLGTAGLDGTPETPGRLPDDPAARADLLATLCAPTLSAPVMFPAYCDLWAQTGPEPAVSPDPAIFLHGPSAGEPDVRLVWRADLATDRPDTWADTVALCPPVAGEALSLPIGLARRWLTDPHDTSDVAGDLESAADVADRAGRDAPPSFRPALRWRGVESSELAMAPDAIRPGDTLVLPATYGGCDAEGWNPDFTGGVTDLADTVRMAARRPAVFRLHPHVSLPDGLMPFAARTYAELDDDTRARVLDALTGVTDPDLAARVAALGARPRLWPHPSGVGLILTADPRAGDGAANFSDEDAASGRARGAVTLSAHSDDVTARAAALARAAGLDEDLAGDVALAARLHDLGKADPRFQVWLTGGGRIRPAGAEPLAKSARLPGHPHALQAARERAGYPPGARHELVSVCLAKQWPALHERARDPDLVLHLIAAHHGHARPFAPVVDDPRPVEVRATIEGHTLRANSATGLERLDSGVADRYWRLVRRYGWWGLAFLEACLRLADHRASEAPARTMEEQ